MNGKVMPRALMLSLVLPGLTPASGVTEASAGGLEPPRWQSDAQEAGSSQEGVSGPEALPEQEAVLEGEATRFARAWVEGDLSSLETMLEPDGIRLHLQGDSYPFVDLPRAIRALRGFMGKFAGGAMELRTVSVSPGDDPRGFADLQWRTRVAGTGEVVVFTLFLSYALKTGSWTVEEIRVLP